MTTTFHGTRHRSQRGAAAWSPIVALVFAGVGCTTSGRPSDIPRVLESQTQALFDAVSAGDAKVWDRYLDDAVMYVSEDGVTKTKADLLREVTPLPPGVSGTLKVTAFRATLHGTTAVTTHLDVEKENYFGQALTSEYRTTDTWVRTSGGWKLVASQVHVELADPPEIQLPVSRLDEYVGTYRLTDTVSYVIRRDGDTLTGQRTERPPQVLKAEVADVLFVPGQPRSRKIIVRDRDGRITGLVDRRDGRDVAWSRE